MTIDFDRYIQAGKDSSMNKWWPKIDPLDIPQPITERVFSNSHWDFIAMIDNGFSQEVMDALTSSAERLGYPVFMRSDQTSGKHSFVRTCKVDSPQDFRTNLPALIEDNVMKDLNFNSIYLREFIELDWKFKAFSGMPVAPERRYFLSDTGVCCHHPYWVKDSIRFYKESKEYESTNWSYNLDVMNRESQEEVALLTEYSELVRSVLPGNWSVDYAKGRNGKWYLIDMAAAEVSWHPDSCPHYKTFSLGEI